VVFRPAMVGTRRRSWRRTRRGRPPCREPGPHNICVLPPHLCRRSIYEQPQQYSSVTDKPAEAALPPTKLLILRVELTTAADDGTMASASTSLGEASARIQATDLERRKTPRVRTALPGLRVEPKWLPVQPDTPCSAKALTRGVRVG
jgi:hypothetical protein